MVGGVERGHPRRRTQPACRCRAPDRCRRRAPEPLRPGDVPVIARRGRARLGAGRRANQQSREDQAPSRRMPSSYGNGRVRAAGRFTARSSDLGVPQRLDRRHPRRPARRQVAREESDAGEHGHDDREGDRVGATGLVEEPGQGPAQQERERERRSRGPPRRGVRRRGGSGGGCRARRRRGPRGSRTPGALSRDVGHDAVDPDRGEQQRQAAKRTRSIEPKRSRASDAAIHWSIVRTSESGWSLSIDWTARSDHRRGGGRDRRRCGP